MKTSVTFLACALALTTSTSFSAPPSLPERTLRLEKCGSMCSKDWKSTARKFPLFGTFEELK
jgi:hypothetical protein